LINYVDDLVYAADAVAATAAAILLPFSVFV